MLKSLEISGFKSFAKKVELDFKSRITAIVGPNGSGKSNVAEAFRFVLGEQSIKSMRGKRGEDLIWNGSDEIPRAGRASVKMVLDNKNQIFTNKDPYTIRTNFEEVIIERIIGRDSMNEYFLNGSKVRLKDIFEILSLAHIGPSGYHIISQGEADKILRATARERKDMIEDALGLNIYEYKKDESEKKLLKTEENIKQVELLRNEVAPHLKFLKKQVEKAEKAEEIKNKLKHLYKDYLNKEKIYIENKKSEIFEEKNLISKELNKLDQEVERMRKIIGDSNKIDLKNKEILEIENKIQSTRERVASLVREIGKIEGEMYANQKLLEKTKKEQASVKNKLVPLCELENLEKEISVLETITQILDKIRFFINFYKNNNDNKNIKDLTEDYNNLLERKKITEKNFEKNKNDLDELENVYHKIQKKIQEETDLNREAEKEIFIILSEKNNLNSKMTLVLSEESKIKILEEEWRREIIEASTLIGREILNFENLEKDDLDKILKEERFVQEKRRRELEKMKIHLEEIGGANSVEIIKEYKETKERDDYLNKELEDLNKSRESLEKMIGDLSLKLEEEFRSGIEKINSSFKEYFSLMFGGGEAELKILKNLKQKSKRFEEENDFLEANKLEDENEKEKIGIEINISLPKKRIKGLEMLSGGERTLTSIALLFALSSVNPPPFIILDETDAALDEANSKKYGDMIEKLSEVSQLILITHNRETMSRAGIIYGVTMGHDGVSRLLSIAFDEAVAVAK